MLLQFLNDELLKSPTSTMLIKKAIIPFKKVKRIPFNFYII